MIITLNQRIRQRRFKAGISGYVLKTSIVEDLIPALRAVMANELFVSPQITDVIIEDYTKSPSKANDAYSDNYKKTCMTLGF
jgi:DNA-binding NarL/FixJ family response regulator